MNGQIFWGFIGLKRRQAPQRKTEADSSVQEKTEWGFSILTKGGLERREIYENTKAGFRRNKKHKRDRDFWEAVGKGMRWFYEKSMAVR